MFTNFFSMVCSAREIALVDVKTRWNKILCVFAGSSARVCVCVCVGVRVACACVLLCVFMRMYVCMCVHVYVCARLCAWACCPCVCVCVISFRRVVLLRISCKFWRRGRRSSHAAAASRESRGASVARGAAAAADSSAPPRGSRGAHTRGDPELPRAAGRAAQRHVAEASLLLPRWDLRRQCHRMVFLAPWLIITVCAAGATC